MGLCLYMLPHSHMKKQQAEVQRPLSYVHSLMWYKDLHESINPYYKPKISEVKILNQNLVLFY